MKRRYTLATINKKLDKIAVDLFKTTDELSDGITKELAIGANAIRSTIVQSMRDTPKTGKTYKRGKAKGKKTKFHIASSPGEAPAIDFGELVRSVFFDVRDMEVEIGNYGGGEYWEFLEDGTSKMKPRPSLIPAVEKHEKEIIDSVGKEAFEIIGKPFEKI